MQADELGKLIESNLKDLKYLGVLKEISYRKPQDDEDMVHTFKQPYPSLFYLSNQLVIAGGDYRVHEQLGIVDREDFLTSKEIVEKIKFDED